MDTSDIEWRIFRKSICNILLTFLVHSVFFHFVTRRLDRSSSSFVLIFVWLIIHINWTSVSCVLVIASHALLTISITYYFKNVLIAYISCVFMATTVEYWAPFSNHLNGYFGSHYKVLKSFSYYQKLFAAKVVGQLFHVKYVLMFGVPRFFAILDGMSPPGAPICPGRVSRFSQLWRYFDQGLHKFLKQQIFMPLIRLFEILDIQSNVFARLTAIFTVFLFVLAWHGLDSSSYLCWSVSTL
uniref:Uncharacterized protein n=1 Tax=Ditylenchus dipsaci TaxID=166011 RepID=A0A915D108_9BILA